MKPRIAIPIPNSDRLEILMRALPQYEHAIREAGGEPVIIDVTAASNVIAQKAKTCDGVLLPGSPADVDPEKYGAVRHEKTAVADPLRDNADELLLQDAYGMRKPIFGICYGLQSLNVWRTGTLEQHLQTGVDHDAGSNRGRKRTGGNRPRIEAGGDPAFQRFDCGGRSAGTYCQLQPPSGCERAG